MERRTRIILWLVVALIIAIPSWIINPELGAIEPISWIGGVLLIGSGYEIWTWRKGKK